MKIGFILSGNSSFPSARIGGFNVVESLAKDERDVRVLHFPEQPSIGMPDLSKEIKGLDAVVFQKKGGPGYIRTVRACSDLGIKTVYSCCDYVPALIQYAKSCDIAVSPSKHMCRLLGERWVWIPDAYEDFSGVYRLGDGEAEPLWFGTLSNKKALDKLVPFLCNTIGDFEGANAQWSLEIMNRLSDFGNVVVVPQNSDSFGMCKGAGRVVQARVLGFPVIASPIPAYLDLPGVLLASTEREWFECLEKLDDPEKRTEVAECGIEALRLRFSPEQVKNRWLAVFFSILGSRRAIKGT